MEVIKYPDSSMWERLASRPAKNDAAHDESVQKILQNVKQRGDEALIEYTREFDGVSLSGIRVAPEEIQKAEERVDRELKSAIGVAKSNIEKFHRSQPAEDKSIETTKGVRCWRKSVPVEKAGLYIPGGSAPLFSTVLMLGIPAKAAGCRETVLCTPPRRDGQVDPVILYTAGVVGIEKVFAVGGAQAIGAMAFGTDTVPKVYKIFGPGNAYVTRAKELVQQEGTAIDMPAGPSELLVIAAGSSEPAFVAADLLSQAEHGPDSQLMLLSTSEKVIERVLEELTKQLKRLPRKKIAEKALANSRAIVLNSLTECMDFSNGYAPEHLILAFDNSGELVDKITNAGSVFLGPYSCESAGDYASGTNHTLPTNGFSKSFSGLSVESFMKKITFQELTPDGLRNIGPSVERMAEAEQLFAHKNAVTLRLKSL